MTTTAYQWVFDRATSIGINKRAVIASTQSRDQTIRTVSRGGQVWRFDVKLPDGIPWTEARQYIEKIDSADRFTQGNVQINTTGYNSWLIPYQGDAVSTTGFTANIVQGTNTITIYNAPSVPGTGYRFRAGDFIQLGGGHVYSVATDVAYNGATVTLNRPVLDANANVVALTIGPSVTWTVNCVEIPDWTIFARNQVSFSGSFKFVEALV